ncbi:hypothetical protein VNO77_01646 [Canavalia gladiata]|uniref:Uncharacterized protein n=1 Tax=Canavalia gladiata TaxID=3824 RepID=A0AAN9MWF4_CANGL
MPMLTILWRSHLLKLDINGLVDIEKDLSGDDLDMLEFPHRAELADDTGRQCSEFLSFYCLQLPHRYLNKLGSPTLEKLLSMFFSTIKQTQRPVRLLASTDCYGQPRGYQYCKPFSGEETLYDNQIAGPAVLISNVFRLSFCVSKGIGIASRAIIIIYCSSSSSSSTTT